MLLAQSDEEIIGQFSGLGWQDWAIAAGTLIVGLIIARIAGVFVKRAVDKTPASEFVGVVLSRITVGIIGFLGFYFALQSLGVPLGPLVGALGIAGLALAFAFQDILENVIAGLLMLMRRPIGIGDEVATNDYEGIVKDVTLRAVEVKTLDGKTVFIPNAMVWKSPVVNITMTPERRTTLEVGVAYDSDLDQVKQLLETTVPQVDGVLADPPARAMVHQFGASSIDFAIHFWHQSDTATMWRVRDEVARRVKRAFDEAGVEIPFPQRVVHLPVSDAAVD
jgi:small-conductance mechanosensitive channel